MPETTEQIILKAAHDTFLNHGFEGSSMQRIADAAGINKALLHYYFRSKDKLFEAVFKEIFGQFIPPLLNILESEIPFTERIDLFVSHYIENLRLNPMVPLFIIHEIQRNPENLLSVMKSAGVNPSVVMSIFKKEMEKGNISVDDPRQLMINILSLCIFPFAAMPLLKGLFFNHDQEAYNDFIEKRKKEVSKFIINAIKIK